MPRCTLEGLDDLEDMSMASNPGEQLIALRLVAGILEEVGVAYGVMGGMNFFIRGSGRASNDVDIAVDNPPKRAELLDRFNDHPRFYLPESLMLWSSGVARIFVKLSEKRFVQLDLKQEGAKGHFIPRDIASSMDRFFIEEATPPFHHNLLSIGPLGAAKLKSHYGRETYDGYHDLRFLCTEEIYASLVRESADSFHQEWKDCFMEKVLARNPSIEQQVRWALKMPASALLSPAT